ADKQSLHGSGIWIQTGDRAEQELQNILNPSIDVSAHKIFIVSLELMRVHHTTGENQVPESWSELLDFSLNRFRFVRGRTIRHVTIRPGSVFSVGTSSGVKQ